MGVSLIAGTSLSLRTRLERFAAPVGGQERSATRLPIPDVTMSRVKRREGQLRGRALRTVGRLIGTLVVFLFFVSVRLWSLTPDPVESVVAALEESDSGTALVEVLENGFGDRCHAGPRVFLGELELEVSRLSGRLVDVSSPRLLEAVYVLRRVPGRLEDIPLVTVLVLIDEWAARSSDMVLGDRAIDLLRSGKWSRHTATACHQLEERFPVLVPRALELLASVGARRREACGKPGLVLLHEPGPFVGTTSVSRENQTAACANFSRSSLSCLFSRRKRLSSSRSAVVKPSLLRPSSRSACRTRFRIAWADGSNSRASSSAVRPVGLWKTGPLPRLPQLHGLDDDESIIVSTKTGWVHANQFAEPQNTIGDLCREACGD